MQTTSIRTNLIGLSFTAVLIEDDGRTLAIIGSEVDLIGGSTPMDNAQLLQLAAFGSFAGPNLKPGEHIIAHPYAIAIDDQGNAVSLDTFLPSGTKVTWWVGLDDEGTYRYFGFDQSDKTVAFQLTQLDLSYEEPDMVACEPLDTKQLNMLDFGPQVIQAIHSYTVSVQGLPTFGNRPSTQGQA